MKNFQKAIAVIALSGMCMAAPAPSAGEAPAKKATKKHHGAVSAEVKKDETAEQLRQLKESVDQQQAATQQLQQQLQQTQQQLQQTQQQLTSAQQEAQKADAKATEVESNSNLQVQKVQSDVSSVKSELNTTSAEVQKNEKKVDYLEHPNAINFRGVRITPGGFLAEENLFRQHTQNADIGSSYNGIPYADSTQYGLTEFRMTARQSRATLLVEGKAGSAKLAGYYEMDFLGAAATANENQSSSFQPRIRQLFGNVGLGSWSVTAGQTWSLITTNRNGIAARSEWVPATIDAQYVVGYTWARLGNVRVAKTFADNKATFAFSLENPAVLVAGQTPAAPVPAPVFGGTGSGQLGNGNTYSANLAPDLIAKVAFDPGYGHYEIKAIGRFFRDRVGETATSRGTNATTESGGIGAAAILPLVHKKIDFIAEGLVGRGIGRFGDSSNVDVTYRHDGSLSPVKNLHAVVGFESQVTPKLFLYAYGGDEYQGRDVYGTGATATGFGVPTVKNTSCFVANSNSCSALMKNLMQGTTGGWYNFYKGAYGTLRFGVQYSYTYKNTWAGVNTNAGATTGAPKANENMAFTSLRYYIP